MRTLGSDFPIDFNQIESLIQVLIELKLLKKSKLMSGSQTVTVIGQRDLLVKLSLAGEC